MAALSFWTTARSSAIVLAERTFRMNCLTGTRMSVQQDCVECDLYHQSGIVWGNLREDITVGETPYGVGAMGAILENKFRRREEDSEYQNRYNPPSYEVGLLLLKAEDNGNRNNSYVFYSCLLYFSQIDLLRCTVADDPALWLGVMWLEHPRDLYNQAVTPRTSFKPSNSTIQSVIKEID
jgi:hypothetical protein